MVQFELPSDLLPYIEYMPDSDVGIMFISFLRKAIKTRGVTEETVSDNKLLIEIRDLLRDRKDNVPINVPTSNPVYRSEPVPIMHNAEVSEVPISLEEDFLADIMK